MILNKLFTIVHKCNRESINVRYGSKIVFTELNNMGAQNSNLRDQAAYGVSEAARYLKLPSATLRSWVVGRAYPRGESVAKFQPLIKPARKEPAVLSFYNLVEAHVLRSLRTDHGVAIRELRKAINYAERALKIEQRPQHPCRQAVS